MGLVPYNKTISQIFNNTLYDIDFYQREYKWNDNLDYKPISSLLKDIFYRFDLEKYNPNQEITPENINRLEWYFLNSFMTNNINGKKYIVDGQQRLTTITLISIALYNLALEKKLQDHVTTSLKNSVIGTTEYGNTYWMGFNDRDKSLEDLLSNNLDFKHNPRNTTEINIYKNYEVIYKRLKEKFISSHKLHLFISYFRNRIHLLEIELEKDKDVAMVFEVINDRGVPLKPYEILKGKILSQINIVDRDKYIDIWEKQISKIEKFGENQIDEFFGFYFRSKYSDNSEQYKKLDKTRYHKTIFTDEFNSKIQLKNNERNAKIFVEKVLPYFIDIYIKMLNYYETYDKNYEWIYFNKLNNMDGQFLLTLSSIKLNDQENDKKIEFIPKYFDRLFSLSNLTSSYKSNDFNSNVISLNSKIRAKKNNEIEKIFNYQLKDIVKKAHDRKELDSPFKYEFFKNLGYNDLGKTFLRYYFARVDHFIRECADLPVNGSYYQLVAQAKGHDVYHIEHIVANNDENIGLFKDEEEFNFHRNRLGGLLLLKGRDNQSSGKETYEDKLKTYNVSGTYYAKTLLEDMYKSKVEFKKFIKQKKLKFRPFNKYAKDEIEERHNLLFKLSKLIYEFN